MHIGILINDREYREALIERLSCYDNNLFVEIINGKDSFRRDSLILTDIDPESLEQELLSKLSPRTVFLTSKNMPDPGNASYHSVFKYTSVSGILSEASIVFKRWRGVGYGRDHTSRIIAVCFENDASSYDKCMSLARQIYYRKGGSVLVVSLSYLNDYGCDEAGGMNRFARMMYAISTGRSDAAYGYTFTDSYGISALMLQKGRNPLAYLGEEELSGVIASLAAMYDTVILDIGTCYRKENIHLSETADNIVFFENGRRKTDIEKMFSKESMPGMIRIRQRGGTDDAMAIDDAVCRIYGSDPDEAYKG